jgi:hypothetical protein
MKRGVVRQIAFIVLLSLGSWKAVSFPLSSFLRSERGSCPCTERKFHQTIEDIGEKADELSPKQVDLLRKEIRERRRRRALATFFLPDAESIGPFEGKTITSIIDLLKEVCSLMAIHSHFAV